MEHNGSYETFLDLDISKENSFIRCLTKRTSQTFILLECHQLHVTYHPLLQGFLPVTINLLDRIINQAGSIYLLLKQIKCHQLRVIHHPLLKGLLPVAKNLLDQMIHKAGSNYCF